MIPYTNIGIQVHTEGNFGVITQSVPLTRKERIYALCKYIFYSLARLFSSHAKFKASECWDKFVWNRVQLMGTVDETFLKTHKLVTGQLKNETQIAEFLCQQKEFVDLINSITTKIAPAENTEEPKPLEKCFKFEALPDSLKGMVVPFLDPKSILALHLTNKSEKLYLLQQGLAEIKRLKEEIEEVVELFEENSIQRKILKNMWMDEALSNPLLDLTIRKHMLNLIIFGVIEESPKKETILLNRKAALIYLENNGSLDSLPEKFRDDPEIVLRAISIRSEAFLHVSPRLAQDRDFVLSAVKTAGGILRYVPHFKDDQEIAYAAVRQYPDAMEFVADKFKDDEVLAYAAVRQDSSAIAFVSNRLKDNKELALIAIRDYGHRIQYVSDRLKDDPEVVMEAVKTEDFGLLYASPRLRDDEKFILDVIKSNSKLGLGNFFDCKLNLESLAILQERLGHHQYLCHEADPQTIIEAIKEKKITLRHLSRELCDNPDVVLAAVKMDGYELRYASDRLQADRTIVLEAVKKTIHAFEHASKKLKNDKKFVLQIIKIDGYALRYASKRLRNNEEIVLAAIRQCAEVYQHITKRLKKKKEVALATCKKMFIAYFFMPKKVKATLFD